MIKTKKVFFSALQPYKAVHLGSLFSWQVNPSTRKEINETAKKNNARFPTPDFQPPTKALKDLGLTGFKLTFLLALVIICVGGNALKLLHEFANVIRAIFGTAGYVFSPHTMIALFSSAAVVLVVTRMLDTSRHNNKENANAKIKVRKAETERELALAHVNAQKNKDNLSAGIQKNRDNLSAGIQKNRDDLSAGIQKHRDGRNAALQHQRDRLVSQEPPYPFMRQNHGPPPFMMQNHGPPPFMLQNQGPPPFMLQNRGPPPLMMRNYGPPPYTKQAFPGGRRYASITAPMI